LIINFIAIISLKTNVSDMIWDIKIRLLFIYITNHDYILSLNIIDSINIHIWYINNDFIYDNQYYSYNINISYYFISKSFLRLFMNTFSFIFINYIELFQVIYKQWDQE